MKIRSLIEKNVASDRDLYRISGILKLLLRFFWGNTVKIAEDKPWFLLHWDFFYLGGMFLWTFAGFWVGFSR